MHRVYAQADDRNHAVHRLLDRLGFRCEGSVASPGRLARMMLELQEIGRHTINWVTPEHVVPQILEALPLAAEAGLRLPIVYNTSGYDGPDSSR